MKTSFFRLFFFALGLTALLASCNRTQITSNRLIDAGEWRVTTLTVNGTAESTLPTLEIDACDIYEATCKGEWKQGEAHAEFAWQFRDNGDTFEINRQGEEEGHEHGDESEEAVIAQCYAFSGIYSVTTRDKEVMEFTSSATLGHSGQTVVLRIEK
ncbi:MAG: hypothetical protein AAGN35_26390 [Bacteroidota bacterium]